MFVMVFRATGCKSEPDPTIHATPDPLEVELQELPPGHPWAGRYSSAFEGLDLSPHFWRLKIISDWIDQNPPHGRVIAAGDHLRMSDSNAEYGAPRDLVIVPWGPRVYLVPAQQLAVFAGDVNAGIEPRNDTGFKTTGRYFLRDGDEVKKTIGRPTLPGGFNRYLLDREIPTRVIRVERPAKGLAYSRVIIDAGRTKGVVPRMMFYLRNPKNGQAAFAAEVRESESLLLYRLAAGESPLKVGEMMTTGAIRR